MYKTFQQRLGEDGFITTPNLKPYFVRMTNKSVSNSIKSKDDFDTNADSSATVRSAVADLGTQLQGILDKTSYDDSTYSNVTKLTSKDTSPFFTQYMETKSGGLTKLEGDDHTTYKGYKLYNSKDVLKTPSEFVNEYKKSYKFADVANKSILMIISAVNTRMTLFRLKRKRLRMKIFLYPKSMTELKMTELIIAFHRNHFQTKQMFSW